MNTPQRQAPTGSVVVGVDGSESGDHALDWAIDQALAEHRPLTLVHGLGPSGMAWAGQVGLDQQALVDALTAAGTAVLTAAERHVAARAPELEVHEVLHEADAREVLLELSRDVGLVVIGSRGRGPLRSLLLGSVGVAVSRHAHCPVVVVRPSRADADRTGVVAGVDGSDRSRPVVEFAYRTAASRDLPLTVLSCSGISAGVPYGLSTEAELQDQRLRLAESVAGMAEKFPEVDVRLEVQDGPADDRLVRAALRSDLVVVGAHHGGPLSRLTRGSVAASVVEHAHCAVAVVPVDE